MTDFPEAGSVNPLSRSSKMVDPLWSEPYLETCCRSAMHRLVQADGIGRPPGLKDGPCLQRLAAQRFALGRPDGRFEITPMGRLRHASEIMARPVRPRRR